MVAREQPRWVRQALRLLAAYDPVATRDRDGWSVEVDCPVIGRLRMEPAGGWYWLSIQEHDEWSVVNDFGWSADNVMTAVLTMITASEKTQERTA